MTSKATKFLKSSNKAKFILSSAFNDDMFTALNAEKKDIRQKIAADLVNRRNEYNFDVLIIKLTQCCFATKGSRFIREGSSDFLADVLYTLAEQTDGKNFVDCCQKMTKPQKSFPKEYQFSTELAHVFSLLYTLADMFAKNKSDDSYRSNMGQNLTNKIFFPLLINAEAPMQAALDSTRKTSLIEPFKDWAAHHSKEVEAYFDTRLKGDTAQEVKEVVENEHQRYKDAILNIRHLIKDTQWQLGGFSIFKGGLPVTLDGKSLRLPHRVAAIAELIKDHEALPGSTTDMELYRQIRAKAQEALDAPRTGQHASTRSFYNNILDDTYFTKFDVKTPDNPTQKLLP